jgi:transcription initiation factor TFIIIB Brf1 subunit/transcription initiation factor TFIIB
MSTCVYCQAPTELRDNGVSVCADCSANHKNDPIREQLTWHVLNTTAKKSEAFRKFQAVMLHFPSGLPHPDGVQRIHNASIALRMAQDEMARAYARLADYLDRGIVPEDLKRR